MCRPCASARKRTTASNRLFFCFPTLHPTHSHRIANRTQENGGKSPRRAYCITKKYNMRRAIFAAIFLPLPTRAPQND